MSELAGSISEIPAVSIDRFNGENLKSTVFFLSPCHTDHMVGLNEPELFESLKHYNLKIYCHKISAALLSALPLYVHLTSYIIPLDSYKETTLNVSLEEDETHTLTVTLIPARFSIASQYAMSTLTISTLTYFETYFRSIFNKFQNPKSQNTLLKYFVISLLEN